MFVFLLFFSLRVCNVSGLACTAFVHADSAFRVLVFMRVFSCLCAFLLTPWPSTCCFFVGAVCSYFCFVRLKCKWAWLLILFALTLCCAFLFWFRRVSFWVMSSVLLFCSCVECWVSIVCLFFDHAGSIIRVLIPYMFYRVFAPPRNCAMFVFVCCCLRRVHAPSFAFGDLNLHVGSTSSLICFALLVLFLLCVCVCAFLYGLNEPCINDIRYFSRTSGYLWYGARSRGL